MNFKYLFSLVFGVSLFSVSFGAISETDYNRDLVGIWAMKPIVYPVKGAANVTQYNEDGTYHLFDYKCTGNGKYSRDETYDSIGTWHIEGEDIVTVPENPEELKKLSTLAEQVRAKLDSMSPEMREKLRSSTSKNILDIIDGNYPVGKEKIITLSSNSMSSKQDLGLVVISLTSLKVKEIQPLCEDF